MHAMHPIADIVAGALLLLLGRKLYWLFVGIAGFYVGVEVARALFAGEASWLVWLGAIGAGLIGAILAMLFQRVGFALGGFYAGGYVALVVVERFAPGSIGAGAFVIGGVVGAVFAMLIMDPAIVILSCLLGAALIVATLGLGDVTGLLVYASLVIVGVVVQMHFMRGARP